MKQLLLILTLLPATVFAGGSFLKPFIKSGAKTFKSSADDIASVGSRSKLRSRQIFFVGGKQLSGKEHDLTSDLFHALWTQDVISDQFVEDIIANGANVNALVDNGKGSILFSSVYRGHKNATKILIEAGADVNLRNNINDLTPLMAAAQKGDVETIRMLIDAKVDINATTKVGRNAISFAILAGHADAVRILANAPGSDVSSFRYADGTTLLTLARRKGDTEIEQILLDVIADQNARTGSGRDGGLDGVKGKNEFDRKFIELQHEENVLSGLLKRKRESMVKRGPFFEGPSDPSIATKIENQMNKLQRTRDELLELLDNE